jgi:hypothetical protein
MTNGFEENVILAMVVGFAMCNPLSNGKRGDAENKKGVIILN